MWWWWNHSFSFRLVFYLFLVRLVAGLAGWAFSSLGRWAVTSVMGADVTSVMGADGSCTPAFQQGCRYSPYTVEGCRMACPKES